MLKKVLSTTLASLLILTTCFAQTTSTKLADLKTQSKLTRADFYNIEPVKVDLEKESYKVSAKASKMSRAAKIGVWTAVIVGAVVLTGFIVWQSIKPKNCSTVNDNLICR